MPNAIREKTEAHTGEGVQYRAFNVAVMLTQR